MSNKLFFTFLLFYSILFSAQEDLRKFQRSGEYFPSVILTENDSLELPIEFDISIDIKNLKGVDINNETFFAKILVSSFSKYDTIFKPEKDEEQVLKHDEWLSLNISKFSKVRANIVPGEYYINNQPKHEVLFYDDFYSKHVYLAEAPFDVNWNLRDYPFDTQQLKFKFTTFYDTSIVKLNPSKFFKSTFSDKMYGLGEGIYLDDFSYNKEYNVDKNDIIQISPGFSRPMITETLVFNLNISRATFWLFVKLFFGGILSFIVSLFMFLLPIKEELESKFALALGAIFGAVGNKYFIASEISGIQVFTKADFISNLVIFMVVFNMLVMILQASDKTNFKYFQSTKNSLIFSSLAFIIMFLFIIII